MRISACLLLLCIAGSTPGAEKLSFDFRGARFNPDVLRYGGPTPEKFMVPEPEGLRLRYTGANAPPTNNPSCVTWRHHVRGNFVATARYEILKSQPPTKGTFHVGPELYVLLDNANSDAVAVARGVYPDGSAVTAFKLLTNATGKRLTTDFKRLNTTDKSLQGRLRLTRNGRVITGSIAEGNDAKFTEVNRSEVGTADVQLVRFAGTAGGDAQAVLDMRILEFELEGEALSLNGPFATPPPKADIPKAKADVPESKTDVPAPTSEATPRPTTEQKPASSYKSLLIMLSGLVVALLVVAGIVFLSRRRKAVIDVVPEEEQNADGSRDV
jgi:hypothetical protein